MPFSLYAGTESNSNRRARVRTGVAAAGARQPNAARAVRNGQLFECTSNSAFEQLASTQRAADDRCLKGSRADARRLGAHTRVTRTRRRRADRVARARPHTRSREATGGHSRSHGENSVAGTRPAQPDVSRPTGLI